MKTVPNMTPSAPASAVHAADRPMPGPTKPIEIVKKWRFPRNQNGPWLRSFACRSCPGM